MSRKTKQTWSSIKWLRPTDWHIFLNETDNSPGESETYDADHSSLYKQTHGSPKLTGLVWWLADTWRNSMLLENEPSDLEH